MFVFCAGLALSRSVPQALDSSSPNRAGGIRSVHPAYSRLFPEYGNILGIGQRESGYTA